MFLRNLALIQLILCTLCVNVSIAQRSDVMGELEKEVDLSQFQDMFTETIKIIGRSKKVFIITNSNQNMGKGDFITLVLDQKLPVLRAVVAKNSDGVSGIKILKLYSLKGWRLLGKGRDIQIVKGDDSWLFKPKTETQVALESGRIGSEEDLYNINENAILNGDIGFEEEGKRHIKPDNILGGAWGRYNFVDTTKPTDTVITASQWIGRWAHQVDDNIWIEGIYGYNLIQGFPDNSQQALVNNLTVRAKYTVKAPMYSFLMPYVGYQQYSVSCPNCSTVGDSSMQDAEAKAVENVEKQSGLIFGVTLLRRLVPGWFLTVDLGTDSTNVGVAIEF